MADEQGAGRRQPGEERRGSSGHEILPEIPPAMAAVMESTTRFSREFLATTFSLVSAAFGLIAALAWNTAITKWLSEWLSNGGNEVAGLFVYAVIVTFIGVVVIVLLARVAARINAAPIEFKYPGSPKQ